MESQVIRLREWQETYINQTLSARDRRLVASLNGVDIREMRDGLYIKASSRVGVIQFESFSLHIYPKLSNLDLVRMLRVTGGLNRVKRYRQKRTYQMQHDLSLFDLLALLLADACETLVRDGLLRGYVVEENDLPVMRGRLLVNRQIQQRYGQINRLECRYDDHHADIPENQILYTALHICQRHTEHPYVRNRVRKLSDVFGAVCRPITGSWQDMRTSMMYNRLNQHYEEAHSFAWMLFEGLGIRDLLTGGRLHGFSFLLDMNALFEQFITVLVRSALRHDEIQIETQATTGGHIWDVNRNQSYKNIIPDVLVRMNQTAYLAIDAKYKRYDTRRLSESDIYQTFLYSYAFQNAEQTMPGALLLYPADGGNTQITKLHIRNRQAVSQARLYALGVSIPRALDELDSDDMRTIHQQIQDIIQTLLAP